MLGNQNTHPAGGAGGEVGQSAWVECACLLVCSPGTLSSLELPPETGIQAGAQSSSDTRLPGSSRGWYDRGPKCPGVTSRSATSTANSKTLQTREPDGD